jgi:hypothetical protein
MEKNWKGSEKNRSKSSKKNFFFRKKPMRSWGDDDVLRVDEKLKDRNKIQIRTDNIYSHKDRLFLSIRTSSLC